MSPALYSAIRPATRPAARAANAEPPALTAQAQNLMQNPLQDLVPGLVPAWLPQVRSAIMAGQALVLVTVVKTQGSTPREAGAHLWVTPQAVHGTIGGGHLEWVAAQRAREMIATQNWHACCQRYALGPSLGQCCGGAVTLMFEPLSRFDLDWLDEAIRLVRMGIGARRVRNLTQNGQPISVSRPRFQDLQNPQNPGSMHRWVDANGQWEEYLSANALPVVVCGAGHVGKEIIRLLGALPAAVTWLDARDDQWPLDVPPNVVCLQGDDEDVRDLPPNAAWLVLTHDHALDMAIVEQVLRHQPFAFLGMIGSKTKAARFRSQLGRRFAAEQIERLTCPVGLVDTDSKLPSVIAISIVAQLLPLLDSYPQ